MACLSSNYSLACHQSLCNQVLQGINRLISPSQSFLHSDHSRAHGYNTSTTTRAEIVQKSKHPRTQYTKQRNHPERKSDLERSCRLVTSFQLLVISSHMKMYAYPFVLQGSQPGTPGLIKQQHAARHPTVITTQVNANPSFPDASRHGTLVKQQYGV